MTERDKPNFSEETLSYIEYGEKHGFKEPEWMTKELDDRRNARLDQTGELVSDYYVGKDMQVYDVRYDQDLFYQGMFRSDAKGEVNPRDTGVFRLVKKVKR